MPSLEIGIVTTIVGMGVVLSILVLLAVGVWLLNKAVDGFERKRKSDKSATAADTSPASVRPATADGTLSPAKVAAMMAAVGAAGEGLSPAKVAAMMTAISAACGRPVTELRFTAIRRTGTACNRWSAGGTNEIIAARQSYL